MEDVQKLKRSSKVNSTKQLVTPLDNCYSQNKPYNQNKLKIEIILLITLKKYLTVVRFS